jgi:hypothetical protein
VCVCVCIAVLRQDIHRVVTVEETEEHVGSSEIPAAAMDVAEDH